MLNVIDTPGMDISQLMLLGIEVYNNKDEDGSEFTALIVIET